MIDELTDRFIRQQVRDVNQNFDALTKKGWLLRHSDGDMFSYSFSGDFVFITVKFSGKVTHEYKDITVRKITGESANTPVSSNAVLTEETLGVLNTFASKMKTFLD